MTTFTEQVLALVRSIPEGSILTYQQVAERAGSPGAARAVGTIMKNNFRDDVPCHRVVRSDYRIGDYNRGGTSVKEMKLKKEGVVIKHGRVIV